jgi:alpha-beta hydrolase superfamily lysophospholipase
MPNFLTSWRWRSAALGVLAAALFGGCAGLEVQERKWIFMPSTSSSPSWSQQGRTEGMDDVWITLDSSDTGEPAKLHALWLDGPRPDAPVLLYLHGARRNVASSAFRIRHMHELGFAVLAVDYRGFGRSTEALPSEETVYEDARAAWDWLARAHPERERYIFGHSLGAAIAVQLASVVSDSKGLIVEGGFTSIPDVFHSLKWGWLPLAPLITQRFDAAQRIAAVKAPVLVVHGSRDTLIRPELGRALYERAAAPKRFVLVEGGTHYSTNGIGQLQYREALRDLFGIGT